MPIADDFPEAAVKPILGMIYNSSPNHIKINVEHAAHKVNI